MESLVYILLFITSVVGLTFIVERGIVLRWRRVVPAEVEAVVQACQSRADVPNLRRVCQQHKSPTSRLLLIGAEHLDWPRAEITDAIQTRARNEVARLERGLVVLEIIVGIAPLLGLVGTILGMMTAFGDVGQGGQIDPAELAKGISLILRATLFGLLIAIPALVFWSYYTKKVESLALELESLCDEFLRRLYREEEPLPRGKANRRPGESSLPDMALRFYTRKRREVPTVIIVALIDILIVLVIFLMVTTTFKQQPALKLALPESSQAQKTGASEAPPLVVSIDPQGQLRLGADARPVTLERLRQELLGAVAKTPELRLALSADKMAPFGQVVKVMDVAKEANLKVVNAYTKETGKPLIQPPRGSGVSPLDRQARAGKAGFGDSAAPLSACGAALGLAVSPAGGQPPPGLAAQKSGGDVVLSLTGAPGSGGTIQYRSGLSASNTWHYLAHFAALSASPCQVTEPGALHAARFYRAFSYSLPTNVVPRSNMVWVAPGVFVMGSPAGEALRAANETQHTVTLTRGFYMNQYEVTQGEYLALMGTNPSRFTTQDYNGNPISPDLNRPVEQVSWIDATNYCGQLTSQERTAGRLPAGWRYRLPTEAEWEYACRAGTATAFSFGNAIRGGAANFQNHYEYDAGIGDLYVPGPEVPWRACTTAVGSYPPNAWGLYDLHGNVWEWCQDWLGTYPAGSVTDPQGPASGSGRVYRGGSWDYWGRYSRSACRFSLAPSKQYDFIGFRVVLAPDP